MMLSMLRDAILFVALAVAPARAIGLLMPLMLIILVALV
jgi:hypothetical protein